MDGWWVRGWVDEWMDFIASKDMGNKRRILKTIVRNVGDLIQVPLWYSPEGTDEKRETNQ
jgi:hypothetical protein